LMLVRETVRAGRLVADMLDLARIEEGVELQLGDVDLVALVAAENARVRELSPAITMTTTAPPPPVVVRADPVRVAQILTNLLDNARRHTGPDGTITITVTTDEQTATVVVANTGQPVAEAERERIFGRLVRLQEARDRDTGGAGLGLPVARGLARAHRGDLVCDPRDDGASFRLTLPAGQDPDHDPLRP
jgi:two-component system OmpR family sensor kinase